MRKGIWAMGSAAISTVCLVVACTGGPGSLPDPTEQQNGVEVSSSGNPNQGTSGSTSTGENGSSGTSNTSDKPPVPTTIQASEFDQSCNAATDCFAVFQGSACQACQCPNAAIATKDQPKYSSTYTDRSKSCPSKGDVQCGACATSTLACVSNKCAVATGITPRDAG